MQSAVLAMIDSVCLSVRPSDTLWYHVKITPATIMRSSLEDSLMTVVSTWWTSQRNSKGNIASAAVEWDSGRKNRQFLANKNTFCGTRYLSHCCSFHGTVVETLSLKSVRVATLTLGLRDVIGHVTTLFAIFDVLCALLELTQIWSPYGSSNHFVAVST